MSRARADLPDAGGHRRRTIRRTRHEARAWLRTAVLDDDVLEDADARCPTFRHDIGRRPSPPPRSEPKEGRRGGFKVWKTPYWKRRTARRVRRNEALDQLIHDQ